MTYACNERCIHCYANYPEDSDTAKVISVSKYKELLDAGVITQEEFSAKKKQLMGI